jgi:hypothetical protein
MSLDFRITMYDYLDGILQAFDEAVKKHGDGFKPVTKQRFKTPAPDNLFVVNEDCDKLSEAVSADFHTIVAKTLYVIKRARPDTCLAIAFLTTRVRAPDTDDWEKLCHRMEYLRGDRDQPLVLGADNDGLLMWYVDASFAVHPNRGHTGVKVPDLAQTLDTALVTLQFWSCNLGSSNQMNRIGNTLPALTGF